MSVRVISKALAVGELSALKNKKVEFRRIAGNTLILYFDGIPGDERFTTLWINPGWRYAKNDRWLLGSADIPRQIAEGEDENSYRARFDEICDRCELTGSRVVHLTVAEDSSDLMIELTEGQKLVSFASYTESENWRLTNRHKGMMICGALYGYEERKLNNK